MDWSDSDPMTDDIDVKERVLQLEGHGCQSDPDGRQCDPALRPLVDAGSGGAGTAKPAKRAYDAASVFGCFEVGVV